ncbi:9242_t:CDS:2 [Gigaspora margarita]|uniref:9242_t:CDS:1 n=1 Tax=Gigaspora margarita TaxID=4874 RepID=A0ABN7UMP4_GIGMA|nr:9242_t:CDS:2 [Gigaspora margarita]
MANMITTQCGKSMNNMIKGYLDANTSLTTFITAFQLALNTQTSPQLALSCIESSDDQNYQYMLTQLLQKVQKFTTQNPTTAVTLYNSFNEIFVSKIEKIDKLQSNSLKITPTIKNPLIIRGKERSSNKKITSTIELASNKKNSKKDIDASRSQDSIKLDNHQSNDLLGEGIILPYEIEKGYPLYIDFTMLPNRVRSLKYELLKIIKGQQFSEYHIDVVKRIQEIGVLKANSSVLQINYFESFQVTWYYGSKGLAVNLETLTKIFVLETVIRLIAEDFNNISLDAAKKVMIDIIEFGLYVHDDDNTENNQYFSK